MHKTETKSAGTIPVDQGNKALANSAHTLVSMRFLESKSFNDYLGKDYFPSLVAFSETCKAARDISSDIRKKQVLKNLLTAVVKGNQALAKKIIISLPELLLDSRSIVTDLSGKEIAGLTPLQAAICAGDVDIVQMMQEVLQQKLQRGIQLSFEPESEIQSQFKVIYPDGIDSVEAAQKNQAQEFKTFKLNEIFTAINAATKNQVEFELATPGRHNPDSPLNTTLHKFRAQFAATSKSEQIFNPFYLLAAFELFNEQFDNFNVNATFNEQCERRWLFWRQVVGYIQRYLSACYLQAFEKDIVGGEITLRYYEFKEDMRAADELGYKYSFPECSFVFGGGADISMECVDNFSKFIATKKSRIKELMSRSAITTDITIAQKLLL